MASPPGYDAAIWWSRLILRTCYAFIGVALFATVLGSDGHPLGTPIGGAAPPPRPAVFIRPNGNDGTCARGAPSRPCATFNRAFQIAAAGDLVQVDDGTYPAQSIDQSTKKSSVTFQPARGARPAVAELSINASHVHIRGIVAAGEGDARGTLDICDVECVPSVVDVVIQGFRGKSAFIRASNVTIRGSDFGEFNACLTANSEDGVRLWGGSVVTEPRNIVLDGVTIHDIASGAGNTCDGTPHEGYHVDCLQTEGGVNITIRNSVFYNCPTSNIQAQPFGGASMDRWTIENNVFGPTACCNNIVLTNGPSGGSCSSLVVRYNVMPGPPSDVYCTRGPLVSYGNIFTRNVSACADQTREAYNVYIRGNTATCPGLGNRKCNPRFVETVAPQPPRHLLRSDRCARGAGDPKRFPKTDIDGQRRPQGRPDAGPDEIPGPAAPCRKRPTSRCTKRP